MSTDERARLEFARRMDDPRFLVAAIEALPDPDAVAMLQLWLSALVPEDAQVGDGEMSQAARIGMDDHFAKSLAPARRAAMVQRGAGATNVRTGWQTNAMC